MKIKYNQPLYEQCDLIFRQIHCWSCEYILLCGIFCFVFSQSGTSQAIPSNNAIDIMQFHPGDAVKITVYPDTAAFPNGVYRIDSKGMIDLPILGLIPIQVLSNLLKLQFLQLKLLEICWKLNLWWPCYPFLPRVVQNTN